jgi:peptidoglycan/xylan/chitin deacetylase (PgdA/CDA1 family)
MKRIPSAALAPFVSAFGRQAGRVTRHAGASLIASAFVLASLTMSGAGCHKASSNSTGSACSAGQALSKAGLTGESLPLKSLAFTFDDGPGARTIELSAYLKSQGIRAVFFVVGQSLQTDGAAAYTLQKLTDDGHLIGNHTQHHYSLTSEPTPLNEAAVVAELTDVDTVIAPAIKNDVWLFRPPYGDWNDQTVEYLEKTPMKKYVGPIMWNIGGTMAPPNQAADSECWKRETLLTVQQCGDLYVKEIDNVAKGIVLMHDPYFIDNNPDSGGTFQMVQYIVPILKSKGYSFVRVDEIPEVKMLLSGGIGPDAGAPGTDVAASTDDTTPGPGANPCP